MPTPYRYVRFVSPALREVRRGLRRAWLTGKGVHCPVCGRSFRAWVYKKVPEGSCPQCDSENRHRLMWLYIERHMTELLHEGRDILHMAPEHGVRDRIRRLPLGSYTTADLAAPDVDVHTDITAMSFPEASFDVVICSHVLEHIPNDRAAMKELCRVLRPGGRALIMVPYSREHTTDEDLSVTDPAERERRWGQFDHVRLYGTDFAARLTEAGFVVNEVRPWEAMTAVARRRFGLVDDSLFVCHRPS